MLHLWLVLLPILAVTEAEPKPGAKEPICNKRLDVITYSEWPILGQFSQELTDNAVLVNVAPGGFDYEPTQVVLHDWRKKTYLHEIHPNFNITNGPDKTRELGEIYGLSVKDIKFGSGFIVILTEDGSVWTAGVNTFGQLSGDTVNRPTFTKVQDVPVVKAIATGSWHCVVLAENGELFSWGDGLHGALGWITDRAQNPTPTKFNLEQEASLFTSTCCLEAACMALTENGELFTWGSVKYIGRTGEYRVPGRVLGIPSTETIVKVACGGNHMLALSSSGRLYGWGQASFGALLQAYNYMTTATELDLSGKIVVDMVAGQALTIVRTDAEKVYYFGMYDYEANKNVTPLVGTLYPRDLMAKGRFGELTVGSVSLGCE